MSTPDLPSIDDAVTATLAEVTAPVAHVLQYFRFGHLPERLRLVSAPFASLAVEVARRSANPETTVALRKLLEAKDAAVRAVVS